MNFVRCRQFKILSDKFIKKSEDVIYALLPLYHINSDEYVWFLDTGEKLLMIIENEIYVRIESDLVDNRPISSI